MNLELQMQEFAVFGTFGIHESCLNIQAVEKKPSLREARLALSARCPKS